MITRRSIFGLCLAPIAPGIPSIPESIRIERSDCGIHITTGAPTAFFNSTSYSVYPGDSVILTLPRAATMYYASDKTRQWALHQQMLRANGRPK